MTNILNSYITDPRQYPHTIPDNELLRHSLMLHSVKSELDKQIHRQALSWAMKNQLQQNQTLSISVALSMATDQKTYQTIWQSLNQILNTQTAGRFVAVPIILIAGAKQDIQLCEYLPKEIFNKILNYQDQEIIWCETWVNADTLSAIPANKWFLACQDEQSANQTLKMLQCEHFVLNAGQEVRLIFAIGFQKQANTPKKNNPEASFSLMQALSLHFSQADLTLFVNPLKPQSVLNGLVAGGTMQLTMALDVFAGNTIRAIRLQQENVGAVIATQIGGKLLFSFSSTEKNTRLPVQGFTWLLSPLDKMDTIIRNFLGLLSDCQVEQVLVCKNPMSENEHYLSYQQAAKMKHINPLTNHLITNK